MAGRLVSILKRIVLPAGVVLAVILAVTFYDRLVRERAAPYFESDEEHFFYGSSGGEYREGIPYWIWLVLPRVFPDLLPGPGGYTTLGLLTQDGHDIPIGLSRVTIGYPRVAMNCAFCHVGSVRTGPGDRRTIVPGAPAHQLAAQGYMRFLTAAASDGRFTSANILAEIDRNYRLSAVDRFLYRFVVIPGTRARLLQLKERSAWMDGRPDWGHGRADVLNTIRFERLRQPADSAVGTTDMMPLWNMGRRQQQGFFWNGLQMTMRDAVVTSAVAAGASRPWIDADASRWEEADESNISGLRRVLRYAADLRPPAYPFPIDRNLAAAGASVYSAQCAQCHSEAVSGAAPVSTGTDAHRTRAWTADASAAYEAFGRRAWSSGGFKSGEHYGAMPLDGLWIRAPYLHNGSVPTLSALLQPTASRPQRFWRGYDVYDPVSVGFVSDGPEAQRVGTLFDTSQQGNSNVGHEYGTSLSSDDRRALLEYLKTL